jgi:5-histidylcysteine sulfoxide synthase/putative 4-mercaptohistidine N1-methyltranferase
MSLKPVKTLIFHNNYDLLKEEIKNYFIQVYKRYESLFECLTEKAYYKRADPLRHPLIFYYGHTATFYINKCIVSNILTNKDRIDPYLESTLAIGVDEMSWDDKLHDRDNWPTVQRVKEYREKVFNIVLNIINNLPLTSPITFNSPWWIIMMGIEHENIHLETSTMLVRHLPVELLIQKNEWSSLCPSNDKSLENSNNYLVKIESGSIKLGSSVINPTKYGWDNEFGEDSFEVEEFETSKFLVSNGEFLKFVEDDGYLKEEYWTEDGKLYLKSFKDLTYPRFWRKDNNNNWCLRTLLKEIEMPWDWPVEVNYLEAKAFCNWKQFRLLTEAEHRLLRDRYVTEDTEANHGLIHQSPCSIYKYNHSDLNDIVGNVWQWTESYMYPFQGFTVHPAYDDFTIPCFDNKHNLIKGSSWVSCGNEIEPESRYAFRQHFYQYAGFRYVKNDNSKSHTYLNIRMSKNINPYETDELVCQYIEFHYGQSYFNIDNYNKVCASEVIKFLGINNNNNKKQFEKAIDIGCSVGRFTFELARYCDSILGIDLSARFIQVCYNVRDYENSLPYVIPIEGDLKEYKKINPTEIRNELGISDDDCNKINFLQKDACNLPLSEYNGYDLIFCGNLIDRLSDPKLFIETIHERIVLNGLLVITSPYTWIEEYTKKDNWIGGKKVDGEDETGIQRLETILSVHFKLIHTKDIEFVIRETKRKFQHTVSEMTIWQKIN